MTESKSASAKEACATSQQVLEEEYRLIWGDGADVRNPQDYYSNVIGKGQAALCLSGGGIRSGAFALGLIQALGRAGLLDRFHYLSTVSGGGYSGSWLQRWIHIESRPAEEAAATGEPAPPKTWNSSPAGVAAVIGKLQGGEEPAEIKHLRENSNFITPKIGVGSNDTWTVVAISVRNIVVNWLLFAPLILLAALAANLFLAGALSIRGAAHWSEWVLYGLLGMTALSIARATFATARLLPSYRAVSRTQEDEDALLFRTGAGDQVLRRRIIHPLIYWAIFATLALAVELLDTSAVKLVRLPSLLVANGGDVAVFSLLGMVAGLFAAAATLRGDQLKTFARDYLVWPAAFLVTASWVGFGAFLFASNLEPGSDWAPVVLVSAGPLWLLTATLIGAIVFAAFRQSEGPSVRPDDDREWLARVSAVKIVPMIGWGVLAFSVLLLNRFGSVDASADSPSWPGIVALVSGVAAVLGGRSERTAATAASLGRKAAKFLPLGVLVGLATLVFIVALLTVFGQLELIVVEQVKKWIGPFMPVTKGATWYDLDVLAHLALAALLGVLLVFLGRKIPVNRFSLNGLYRNRLARGFLGAARPSRRTDPYTGFDSADNVRLHLLAPKPEERAVLYPVINAALNVTATENLAWQERKAEPFVFTPLYSGSGMLSPGHKAPGRRTGAYVPSAVYAGREPDFGMNEDERTVTGETPLGITLAMAMSISGAAATPNMGYYSSPATALLMTLFNVRLGAWLPNPALAEQLKGEISRPGPKNSIAALISELRGSTHDRGEDIYLSDGGHFENLALYEMVRRRCRFILVSDGGADPSYSLKDLGNAVRKVKIDLDVDIRFGKMHLSPRDKPLKPELQLAWAIGEVCYPERGPDGERLKGQILYIKPSYFGESDGLPVDVVAYARSSEKFPHESTADQFFSESQFESYRRLAEHFATELTDQVAKTRKERKASDPVVLGDLFAAARLLARLDDKAAGPPVGPA
jgi:hypothetical protein